LSPRAVGSSVVHDRAVYAGPESARPPTLELDGAAPRVRVRRRLYRVSGTLTVDVSKSYAGGRTVALPAFVAAELRRHLA